MTRAEAIARAHELGLAAYPRQTIAQFLAQIECQIGIIAEQEAHAAVARRRWVIATSRRTYRPHGQAQMTLAIALRRDLSRVRGVCVSR